MHPSVSFGSGKVGIKGGIYRFVAVGVVTEREPRAVQIAFLFALLHFGRTERSIEQTFAHPFHKRIVRFRFRRADVEYSRSRRDTVVYAFVESTDGPSAIRKETDGRFEKIRHFLTTFFAVSRVFRSFAFSPPTLAALQFPFSRVRLGRIEHRAAQLVVVTSLVQRVELGRNGNFNERSARGGPQGRGGTGSAESLLG